MDTQCEYIKVSVQYEHIKYPHNFLFALGTFSSDLKKERTLQD